MVFIRNKWLVAISSLVLLGGIIWLLVDYLQIGKKSQVSQSPTIVSQEAKSRASDNGGMSADPVDYTVEVVAENLVVPWSIVFTGNSRMLVTERPGRVREVVNDQLKADPVRVFPEVHSEAEEGLMGMVKHPDYENNGWIYVCLAYQKGDRLVDKVVRFIDPRWLSIHGVKSETPGVVGSQIIIDNIPAAKYHAGCELKFGLDEKLYITTGDATDKDLAQDMSSLAGKILRLNDDGSTPEDNPFYEVDKAKLSDESLAFNPRNYIFSYGHRNPQGIDWHPESQQLWSTEHGPSGFDGPGGGDEVNLIKPGENYGWPVVSHQRSKSGMVDPKLVFTPAEAPASAMFYTTDLKPGVSDLTPGFEGLPQFENNLFFAALRGEKIVRIILSESYHKEIISYESLDLKGTDPGRIREVIEGPDGAIYFTTSNRDGRGRVRTGDDKVYRISPISNI